MTETTTGPVGFVGQGFIGKHMADDFVRRGYEVVRYALEAPYHENKDGLATCAVVFVAVPTPTTPHGFDASILEAVLAELTPGQIVVIKSTILPGSTARLQAAFPELILLHSPEFLREKHAAKDTAAPERTIIGLPLRDEVHEAAAETVRALLPESPYTTICNAAEAELIKYGGNNFLALKVVYMNMLYDMATALGARYDTIAEAMAADPRIGTSHMQVVDSSGHDGAVAGRGAGGHCFPKDLAAFQAAYAEHLGSDTDGGALWSAIAAKNNALLVGSGKDLDLLNGIYGAEQVAVWQAAATGNEYSS